MAMDAENDCTWVVSLTLEPKTDTMGMVALDTCCKADSCTVLHMHEWLCDGICFNETVKILNQYNPSILVVTSTLLEMLRAQTGQGEWVDTAETRVYPQHVFDKIQGAMRLESLMKEGGDSGGRREQGMDGQEAEEREIDSTNAEGNDANWISKSECNVTSLLLSFPVACAGVVPLCRCMEDVYDVPHLGMGLCIYRVMKRQDRMESLESHVLYGLSVYSAPEEAIQKQKKMQSLFQFLNKTQTTLGSATLRSNLRRPLCCPESIQERQRAIRELGETIEEEDGLFARIQSILGKLPRDPGKMITCIQQQMRTAARGGGNDAIEGRGEKRGSRIASFVKSCIELKGYVAGLQEMTDALAGSDSTFFKKARDILNRGGYEDVLRMITDLFTEERLQMTQKAAFLNRTQQCFALKSDVNPNLELCRAAFSEATEAVHDLLDNIRDRYPHIDRISIQYTETRGFFLTLPHKKRDREGEECDPRSNEIHALPEDLHLLVAKDTGMQCTTDELNALNARIKQASDSCLCITESILEEKLGAQLTEKYLPRIRLSLEGIGLVDFIMALANVACAHDGFVAPIVTRGGPLVIQEGRHVLMEGNQAFQPNDTWMASDSLLHIIAGPNMSGKSTYLKQVGLLVIMAQIGSYVPCSFMTLSCFRQLFLRSPTVDHSITSSMSSFMGEMVEMKCIIERAGPRSLVLVDELGRSTSYADGLSISMSVLEALMTAQACTLMATHFLDLCKMSHLHPQCTAFHFSLDMQRNDDGILEFQRVLKMGIPPSHYHYGLELANTQAWPKSVLSFANQCINQLHGDLSKLSLVISDHAYLKHESLALAMISKIKCITEAYEINHNESDLRKSLEEIQDLL